MSHSSHKVYFKGLNALRFFAASLVILMHLKSNLSSFGYTTLPELGLFSKGLTAVSFFFVLSGFLITYLLFQEEKQTKTINIRAFYLRRIYRIWPLYFLVTSIGIFFYWYALPYLGIEFDVKYDKPTALFLYLFFGANVINSLYHVGGILHVTWSIAVEEQFYLIWAPLFKKFKKRIHLILWVILIISLIVNIFNKLNLFQLTEGWQLFVDTLQFHYMCIGGLFAFYLYHHKSKLLSYSVFSRKSWQVILTVFILGYLIFYQKTNWLEPILILPQGFLFGWLIVNISSNRKALFHLENSFFNHLGKISYGLYMYHMIIVYALSFVVKAYFPVETFGILHLIGYVSLVFGITILIAHLSFKYLEKPLILKGSKHSQRLVKPSSKASDNSDKLNLKLYRQQ